MKSITVFLMVLALRVAGAQGTVPTFEHAMGTAAYRLVGHDPGQGGATTIPTVLVPVSLAFESKRTGGKPFVMDAGPDAARVVASPIFAAFAFPTGGTTQYADALLRATFPKAEGWHTLLGKPEVRPVQITIPAGYGFVLTSRKTGAAAAIVDIEFLQKQLFQQIAKQDGKLVIAVTHNTAYYTEGDATLCCSWGTHGVDAATGNSFVLGSYLHGAPVVVEDRDVQPLTQQLGEFVNDPLHDPLAHGGRNAKVPGNAFPGWLRPVGMRPGDQGGCGGTGVATSYFLLEPTNTNRKNNFPASAAFAAREKGAEYHLQNVALLPWYTGAAETGAVLSFPDARALSEPAKPCPGRGGRAGGGGRAGRGPTEAAVPVTGAPNGHKLIGYWAGYGGAGSMVPLREVSPQWDYILVAFATPDRNAPEGTMQFHTPAGMDAEQFKGDIRWLGTGQEGDDFTGRRRAAFYAGRSEAGAELRRVGDADCGGLRVRRHRYRLRKPVAGHRCGRHGFPQSDHALDCEPDCGTAAVARALRGELYDQPGAGGDPGAVGLSELWRAVRVVSADHLRHPRHSYVCGRAGLQHAAAGGAGWRDLSARLGGLSCGNDRTAAARVPGGRRSEAVLPGVGCRQSGGGVSYGRHHAGDCK